LGPGGFGGRPSGGSFGNEGFEGSQGSEGRPGVKFNKTFTFVILSVSTKLKYLTLASLSSLF